MKSSYKNMNQANRKLKRAKTISNALISAYQKVQKLPHELRQCRDRTAPPHAYVRRYTRPTNGFNLISSRKNNQMH